MLLPHVEPDSFAAALQDATYTVWSLYFDTRNLDFYHEKLAGIRERIKVRVRAYDAITLENPVFLELKKKSDSTITKRRSAVRYRDLTAALREGDVERYLFPIKSLRDAPAASREFMHQIYRRGLAPVVIVAYEREAYVSRHEPWLRITLDKNLRSFVADGLSFDAVAGRPVRAIGQDVILEVKTDFGIPLWLRLMLSRFDVNREALSKYGMCIDSLNARGVRCGPTRQWVVRDACVSLSTPEI